eukprot:m.174456 g.174456  ORF g.174456 m.174456 type:complete len:434 (+) comp17329_c1_seq2:116-1417(+)
MSGAVYGGDEVGAVVLDVGTYNTKAGFAGEDTPKVVFPTTVGCLPTTADPAKPATDKKSAAHFIGTQYICKPRAGMEMVNPLKDSMVDNWDLFEQVVNHAYRQGLQCETTERPIMIVEPSWNEKAKREKMTEIFFEKYNVPALYISKDAVLSAFSSGRSTALILSSGANCTSAVPVYDGYVVTQAIRRNELAGDFLTEQYSAYLEEKAKVDVIPNYMIASKTAVGEDLPPQFELKKNLPQIAPSYHAYMRREVVRDFQVSVTNVNDKLTFDADTLSSFPTSHYEFPNGFNANYGLERYSIPEAFFDPENHIFKKDRVPQSTSHRLLTGHQNLIRKSIGLCDADLQLSLWSNVVLAGANTLHNGYSERLNNEIVRMAPPGNKYKIISSSSSQERMFSSWVGGSILGSLGSFQQMWFSKAEYAESGKAFIDKKCP